MAQIGCHGWTGQPGVSEMPGLGLSCWNKPALPGEQKGSGQMGHHGVGVGLTGGAGGTQCLWAKGWLPLHFLSLAFGRALGWLLLFSEICLRCSVLRHSVRRSSHSVLQSSIWLHSECRGRAVLHPTRTQRHCRLSGAMERGLINIRENCL